MYSRQRQRVETLRGDQAVIRRAAQWVRDQAGGRIAALSDPVVAAAGGRLLDGLADALDRLDAPDRDHVVRVCRELTGDSMDQPARRRTRRRG